jgi:hypothetical protein
MLLSTLRAMFAAAVLAKKPARPEPYTGKNRGLAQPVLRSRWAPAEREISTPQARKEYKQRKERERCFARIKSNLKQAA